MRSFSGRLQGEDCLSYWPASLLRELPPCEVDVGLGIPERASLMLVILGSDLKSVNLKERQRSSWVLHISGAQSHQISMMTRLVDYDGADTLDVSSVEKLVVHQSTARQPTLNCAV